MVTVGTAHEALQGLAQTRATDLSGRSPAGRVVQLGNAALADGHLVYFSRHSLGSNSSTS